MIYTASCTEASTLSQSVSHAQFEAFVHDRSYSVQAMNRVDFVYVCVCACVQNMPLNDVTYLQKTQ